MKQTNKLYWLGTLVVCLTACASSHNQLVQALNSHEFRQVSYCDSIDHPEPMLPEVVEGLNFEPDETTAMILNHGASAIIARAWLSEHATETIDAQYFIFATDNLGLIAIDHLLLAAERGVRVRLIVDDTLNHGDPNVLLALALHPNADVRIYNPNINVGTSVWTALGNVFTDFRGVNQRMHNKLFVADGQVAITGGRNVGAEYFDLNHNSNFRDRDVLLVNGAVQSANESFQEFWDSEIVVPIESIMGEPEFEPERAWLGLHEYSCNPENYLPSIRQRVSNLPNALRERLTGDFAHSIGEVEYVSDPPEKNDTDGMRGGGTSTDRLLELVNSATESVLIQSPYLVTTEVSQGLFRAAVERGVSVKIITNSLAVTDNYQAFSGYQRSRQDLLDAGVEIYELRPNTGMQGDIMNGPVDIINSSSLAVHAKSLVVDFEVAVIGSFNLDPRSANLNTESITVLHSETIANQLARQIQQDMAPENSWRTTSDFNPDSEARFGLRLKSWMARILPMSIL